jgi:hypothetical protein
MKTIVILFLAIVSLSANLHARSALMGSCMQGNSSVVIPLFPTSPSVNKYEQSFPSCTVTVYLADGVTLATIYSDNASTPLANPFTATTGGFFLAYADNGQYVVKLSGAGISGQITLSGYTLFDPTSPSACGIHGTFVCEGPNGVGSYIGNNVSAGNTDVVILINNVWTNPTLTPSEEIQGIHAETHANYTLPDPNPGADNKPINGITVIDGTVGNIVIYGQQNPVRAEIWALGSSTYSVLNSQDFQATIPQLNSGATLTNWSGLIVNPPDTNAGGGHITNGNGITIDLGSGSTITNPVAIEIVGLGNFGQIQWPGVSITESPSGTMLLDANTEILTDVGLVVGVGGSEGVNAGSFAVGGTTIINSNLSITTSALIRGAYFTTINTGTPPASPANSLTWFSKQVAGVTQGYYIDPLGNVTGPLGTGGGGGGVTNFSAGNLSPLFTTSVATSTTTPALSFALSTATPYASLMNDTDSSAVPSYVAPSVNTLASSTSITCGSTYNGNIVSVSNSGAQTLTLPGTVCADGFGIFVQNTAAGTWTINRNGNTIDGGSTNPTVATGGGIYVRAKGGAWYTFRGNASSGSGCSATDPSACWLIATAVNAGNTGGANSFLALKDAFALGLGTNSTLALNIDAAQNVQLGGATTSSSLGGHNYQFITNSGSNRYNYALASSGANVELDFYRNGTILDGAIYATTAGFTIDSATTHPLFLETDGAVGNLTLLNSGHAIFDGTTDCTSSGTICVHGISSIGLEIDTNQTTNELVVDVGGTNEGGLIATASQFMVTAFASHPLVLGVNGSAGLTINSSLQSAFASGISVAGGTTINHIQSGSLSSWTPSTIAPATCTDYNVTISGVPSGSSNVTFAVGGDETWAISTDVSWAASQSGTPGSVNLLLCNSSAFTTTLTGTVTITAFW